MNMLKFDESFLEEVGLSALPAEEKKPFLDHILEELQERLGIRLSEGLSDEQLDEFGAITDLDDKKVNEWLALNASDYITRDDYKELARQTGYEIDSLQLNAEYAAGGWFDKYRPNYQDVVMEELDKLKAEIKNSKDAILGA